MARPRRKPLAALLGLGAMLFALPAQAGSFVIRDETLRTAPTAPSLGQGFSLATHAFQGSCFSPMTATEPSYDFRYRFEAISETQAKSLLKITRPDPFTVEAEPTGKAAEADPMDLRAKAENAAKSTATKANQSAAAAISQPKPGDKVTQSNTLASRLYIEVALEFQVYNRSLNEGESQLSSTAKTLVSRRDLLSFFDACGMYYVRSINRVGSYVSVLSYDNPTGERDPAFEAEIETMIKGWGMRRRSTSTVPPPPAISQQVITQAARNRLTIQSTSVGFGKRTGNGSLIAQDLQSFREAILSAFSAIQAEDVGLVASVEVVPWAENAQFQEALALAATDVSVVQNGTERTVSMSPHQQRRILTMNAEFLSELGRATRDRLALADDARKCREDIEREYRERDEDGTWRWARRGPSATWQNAKVQNQRTKEWDRTLDEVWEIVNPERAQKLQDDYHFFVYGVPAGAVAPPEYTSPRPDAPPFAGANACMTDLLADEVLLTRPYRDLPACQRIEEFLTFRPSSIISEYCRPKVE